MSILGLTLDYGPFGFLDDYNAGFICNHTDEGGRYAFERQPGIGLWNCRAFATALSSLVSKADVETALATYEPTFRNTLLALLRAKFGVEIAHDDDASLFAACLEALQNGRVDYTNFFRALSGFTRESSHYDDSLTMTFGTARSGTTGSAAIATASPSNVAATRRVGRYALRQPGVRPAQLPRAKRDRGGGSARLFGDRAIARCATRAVRRAAGARGLRGNSARIGPSDRGQLFVLTSFGARGASRSGDGALVAEASRSSGDVFADGA